MRFPPLVALTLAAATLAEAQEPVATRPKAPPVPVLDSTAPPIVTQTGHPANPSCWRARFDCKTFFLTDIGLEFPLASTWHADALSSGGRARDFGARLVWTIGFMNTRGAHSHGPAASVVAQTRLGSILEYRYRHWTSGSSGLDLGLGYRAQFLDEPGQGVVTGKGVTALVAFTPSRWIGASARVDLVRAAGTYRRGLALGIQSTRVSEEAFKLVVITAFQALLEKIGIDTSNEN